MLVQFSLVKSRRPKKLKSLPGADGHLKPGVTFEALDRIAFARSDLQAARRAQRGAHRPVPADPLGCGGVTGQDPDPRGAVRPAFPTACPPPLSCSRGPRPWTGRGKRYVVRRPPERVRQTPPTSRDRAESAASMSPARIEPPARRRQTGTRTRATRGLSHAAWPTPRSCSLSHWTTLSSAPREDSGAQAGQRLVTVGTGALGGTDKLTSASLGNRIPYAIKLPLPPNEATPQFDEKAVRCPGANSTQLTTSVREQEVQGMVPRKTHLRNVEALLRDSPVGAMIGARQVGKTTLARQLVQQYRAPANVFDLESSADLAQRQRIADDHHYR